MANEQLPETLGPDEHARALLKYLESDANLEPTLRQQLLDALVAEAPQEEISGDVENVTSDTADALNTVSGGKVSLESLEPRSDYEANALRAVKALKMLLKKGNNQDLTATEEEEAEWYQMEFDINVPGNRNAVISILRDYAETVDLDDVKCFFGVLNRGSNQEWFRTSFSGMTGVPKGFSKGDLLEIRRTLIQRYLDEIPENEDDPYNSPKLWYGYLLRPDVYCYERGEDVRFLVDGAIQGYGSQEAARPDRAAYVRAVLEDTLKNLNHEKDVVAKLEQLYEQFPSYDYTFSFVHRAKGRGEIVIQESHVDKKVVRNIRPEKPMIAQDFNVIR
ncbi:hypothetical protein COY07_04285 [Candidatus Peregrinibacteria bacterium CG_4_10_14_0_2_um_filter_43_11]|nr:MAG: hypothetical protein COY07_04285 [Candidatus Peregrinibacteria bacterium CG_4_10_14_0_2_um_filter_43_11]